jgi:zinc ribbon protein
LSFCSNCGRELPQGALFCPECGARAADYSVSQYDVSPSHFNSGMTATSQPQTTVPGDDSGFPPAPPPPPEAKRRSSLAGGRGLALVVILALAILLVGVIFEAGVLGPGASPAVNSASTPLTGQQLLAAYAANQTQADASYANRTIYVQDSLDFGVGTDPAGQPFSSINSGSVILVWANQAQVGQLSRGDVVLARCSVAGMQPSLGGGYALYLQDCDLISVRSPTASSASVSVANL